MKIILQHDERDCGAACLGMIAWHYGLRLSLEKMRHLTKTDKSGTNLYGLTDGARQIGLKGIALSGSADDLMKEIKEGKIKFPFIAHIVSEENMLHFVIIYGIKNEKFLIADPGKGRRKQKTKDFFSVWTGSVVAFEKTSDFKKGNYATGTLTRTLKLLRNQRIKLAWIFISSLVIALIGITGSFIFEIAIDGFIEVDEGTEHSEEVQYVETEEQENVLENILDDIISYASSVGINSLFIGLIGLYLLQASVQFLRGCLIISVSKQIDIKLVLTYYNHIMDLPIENILKRQTGEYLSRFSDASVIRDTLSDVILTLLLDSLMVIAAGVILYMENSTLFFISLTMVGFYMLIVIVFRKPFKRSNRNVMENDAILQAYFKESIDGAETVKASRAEEAVKNTAKKKFMKFISSAVKSSVLSVSQNALSDTAEMIGVVLILWIGFSMVISGQITIGTLISYYALMAYFSEPVKNLTELQPQVQSAFVAIERLNDILEQDKEPLQTSSGIFPSADKWEISHIDFRYGNRSLVLNDVNISFFKGQKIALVGESGSGKTTIAKLLLGFYKPERGTIKIDDVPIEELSLAELRSVIAYVKQETFLFADTIKNNLRLGNEGITDEEIQKACEQVNIDQFIQSLPLGYDTPVEENGANLSGGQKQRLAIARSLLRNPKLLILDEATSHLDTITEDTVKNTIFGLADELTCIVIAHRLSTVKNCDCIYVMKNGTVVEHGTHDQLMAKHKFYYNMWRSEA
ncbi:MAG: peptidase domain-containing ABC transporter [Bacteroides sp.]|nr:peptidase domain-containing ABC transporter [Eubacterium sp.]MCM1417492.1 peptidase domain-containing ABC transporter [Roseburia sp.]MCM1462922.1 peptidase domain-containing ABC transporter [Bacteroides sp.]